MEEARVIIDRLRIRIAGIVAERVRCESNLQKVTIERDNMIKHKAELEEKVALLERRIKVLELSGGVSALEGGAKSARERVNKLLREVDKCLTLMNK